MAPEPKRTRPAAIWTGAGALLTGAVWAATQLMGGAPAEAHEPRVTTGSFVAREPGSISLDERLAKIEGTLATLQSQVGELRDQIPKKHTP